MRDARCRERRRQKVQRTDHRLTLAGLQFPRPAHEERHADAALVVLVLAAAQRRVHRRLRERAAVVADEKEQRVFPHSLGLERRDDFADRIVHPLAHREQRVAVGVAGVKFRDLIRGRLQRRVDGVEREIHEERLRLFTRDECRRRLAEPVREIARLLHGRRAAIDRIVRVVQLEIIVRAAPEKAEHVIEPAQRRAPRHIRPEVPLSKLRRRIARRFEMLRKNLLAHRHSAACLTAGVKPKPLLIPPRHQPRARRRTHMPAHIALPADHALLRQRVEMRRGDFLRMLRIEEHIRVAEIIRDDDDDVWLRAVGAE